MKISVNQHKRMLLITVSKKQELDDLNANINYDEIDFEYRRMEPNKEWSGWELKQFDSTENAINAAFDWIETEDYYCDMQPGADFEWTLTLIKRLD